jgi:hypothetical protein
VSRLENADYSREIYVFYRDHLLCSQITMRFPKFPVFLVRREWRLHLYSRDRRQNSRPRTTSQRMVFTVVSIPDWGILPFDQKYIIHTSVSRNNIHHVTTLDSQHERPPCHNAHPTRTYFWSNGKMPQSGMLTLCTEAWSFQKWHDKTMKSSHVFRS